MDPRRRLAGLAAVALAATLLLQGCADPATAPPAASVHPCGAGTDPATARVVDVYLTALRYLVGRPEHRRPGARVLYLVDHAVPELQETGIPEWEKRTPAPASRSTAEFPAPVRRCLDGARFDGLLPIRLVQDWDDPAIPSEPVDAKGWPAGQERPWRYLDGRLFSLGGVPEEGDRLALAAGSSGGFNEATGALLVLRRDAGTWRVTGQERYWVT